MALTLTFTYLRWWSKWMCISTFVTQHKKRKRTRKRKRNSKSSSFISSYWLTTVRKHKFPWPLVLLCWEVLNPIFVIFKARKATLNPPGFLFLYVSHRRFHGGFGGKAAVKSLCNVTRDGFHGGWFLRHIVMICSQFIFCWSTHLSAEWAIAHIDWMATRRACNP